MTPFSELMSKMVEECAVKRAEMIETMLIPFLQHTGLSPDEVELVERTEGSTIVLYFRKKEVQNPNHGGDVLVLTRKTGERIAVGKDIEIVVLEIDRGKVRLGISAPKDVGIYRTELMSREDFVDRTDLLLGPDLGESGA